MFCLPYSLDFSARAERGELQARFRERTDTVRGDMST